MVKVEYNFYTDTENDFYDSKTANLQQDISFLFTAILYNGIL